MRSCVHMLWSAAVIGSVFAAACKRAPTVTGSSLKDDTNSSSSGKTFGYHGMIVNDEGVVISMATPPKNPLSNGNDPQYASNNPPSGTDPSGGQSTGFGLQDVKTKYMTDCETAGVPLPPAWGDAEWKLQGDLDQLFAGSGKTQLWTYTDPKGGTCAAIPRFARDGVTVNLFGVICAGSDGKACFFDNADPRDGRTRVAVPNGYKISDGSGADVLSENCTSCHRGENPWVATPGEPTAKLPKLDYSPIGPAAWTNPPGDGKVADCESCHSIPALSPAYCGIGLAMIRRGVMPPRGKTDGVDEFTEACRNPGATTTSTTTSTTSTTLPSETLETLPPDNP